MWVMLCTGWTYIFLGMQSAPAALILAHRRAASLLLAMGPACRRVTVPALTR